MTEIRGESDACLEVIAASFVPYEHSHPHAEIVLYRQNSVSVRIRIIDASFKGVHKADRHDAIWELLSDLPEDQLSQVTLLLLLTPQESSTSFANMEFEHPVPSSL